MMAKLPKINGKVNIHANLNTTMAVINIGAVIVPNINESEIKNNTKPLITITIRLTLCPINIAIKQPNIPNEVAKDK
jgi:hypothetical protein